MGDLPRKWLLLDSPDYARELTRVLDRCGCEVLADPPAWSPRCGLHPEMPDAVVTDHNAGKERSMLAGFYRGYGLPLVYVSLIGRPPTNNRRLARTLGAVTVAGVSGFEELLIRRPHYLRASPPGRDLTPEVIAAFLAEPVRLCDACGSPRNEDGSCTRSQCCNSD